MRAFDIIFEMITQSKPQNGHIRINELNKHTLRKANIEITEMLKKAMLQNQSETSTKEPSSQEFYLVS